jgi:segregation and condensation protein A
VALQDDYQVRLDSFQGPLDLLLFLIRRAEVDIADIPISRITDQYFAFLKQLHTIDIDVAGEFLVMAATLVEIKSRTLAPAQKRVGDDGQESSALDDTDPRFELVKQLLAYQKYRSAADELSRLRTEFAQRWAVGGRGATRVPGVYSPRRAARSPIGRDHKPCGSGGSRQGQDAP